MVIAFPNPPGGGGPGSFQRRFEQAVKEKGHIVTYYKDTKEIDAIFVVGGSKKIGWLLLSKLKGIPIIHRLDGINWIHRKTTARRNWRNILVSEAINVLTNILHSFIATCVVYQSFFVKEWWKKSGFKSPEKSTVIVNGVFLDTFFPRKSGDKINLVCVEGLLDYSPYAIELINYLFEKLEKDIKLIVYGGIKFTHQKALLNKAVDYRGTIEFNQLPTAYQNAIYLSLDVNAACPNTVVEALASGAPVVGFDTGALRELVPLEAGIIVPYGSDPWQLGFPDADALAGAIFKVRDNWASYSRGARQVAEERYDINTMIDCYLQVIESCMITKKQT